MRLCQIQNILCKIELWLCQVTRDTANTITPRHCAPQFNDQTTQTRHKHDTTLMIIEQTNTTHQYCPPTRNDLLLLLLLLLLHAAAGMAVDRRLAVWDGDEGRERRGLLIK